MLENTPVAGAFSQVGDASVLGQRTLEPAVLGVRYRQEVVCAFQVKKVAFLLTSKYPNLILFQHRGLLFPEPVDHSVFDYPLKVRPTTRPGCQKGAEINAIAATLGGSDSVDTEPDSLDTLLYVFDQAALVKLSDFRTCAQVNLHPLSQASLTDEVKRIGKAVDHKDTHSISRNEMVKCRLINSGQLPPQSQKKDGCDQGCRKVPHSGAYATMPRGFSMGLLNQIEPRFLDGALQIVETLREAGYEALFAGGVVRDLLLRRPVSDIDVTTSAPPETIERLFDHTIPVGRQFGVVIVIIDSVNYEVATFRKDFDYQDGRHPGRVEFTSAQEDSQRRDFTINALMLDPDKEEVIDFVEGRQDLENRIIRTVGDPEARFREDKLRLMRAIRFASELDFQIDDRTKCALKGQAREIRQVSHERIRDELLKTLVSRRAGLGLEMLRETGLLEVILPEVAAMSGVEQPPEFHPEGDVFVHTCLMLKIAEELHPVLALGVLLHDVGKPPTFRVDDRIRFNGHAELGAGMAEDICRRLRVSREDTHRVVDLVKDHLRFMHVQEMRESTLKRFLRKDHFDDHLELHRLDCLASRRDLSNYEFCCRRLKEIGKETLKPALFLSGHDLIELGFAPGPIFSRILASLEDKQLEAEITNREEALEWVRTTWTPSS